jgi:hypothetical protein
MKTDKKDQQPPGNPKGGQSNAEHLKDHLFGKGK